MSDNLIIHQKKASPSGKEMPEKKLTDRLCEAIRLRGYSLRTEKACLHWYERFVRFHKLRHPASMGAAEVVAFLTHLAVKENVAASTQNQALGAVLFLSCEVLHQDLGRINAQRAQKPKRLRRRPPPSSGREQVTKSGQTSRPTAPSSAAPLQAASVGARG